MQYCLNMSREIRAEEIIQYLEKIGTVFSTDDSKNLVRRAFGGQSYKRTYYCGASTGKQIVSALVMEVRRYEAAGVIQRRLWSCFHSALIKDGVCYGAVLFDEAKGQLDAVYADAMVIATGGQNGLFGKTTGSISEERCIPLCGTGGSTSGGCVRRRWHSGSSTEQRAGSMTLGWIC